MPQSIKQPVKPHIKLIMNVRDDAEKLLPCFESVANVISSWYVIDTGSTDETPNIVLGTLQGEYQLPGKLDTAEWVGHAHNRSLLLYRAREYALRADNNGSGDGTDYCLMMDSDMLLDILPGGELENLVLEKDMYLIDIHDRHIIYPLPLLTTVNKEWQYKGVAHSFLAAVDGSSTADRLRQWRLIDTGNGNPRAGKLEKDMQALRNAVAENPDDTRSWYYLAQTYRDLEMWPEAVQAYRFRAGMGGWEEELYSTLLNWGIILTRKMSVEDGLQLLLDAWKSRPHRAEALRAISSVARIVADQLPYPESDVLFVDKDAYIDKPVLVDKAIMPLLTTGPGFNKLAIQVAEGRRPGSGSSGSLVKSAKSTKLGYNDVSAIIVTRGNVDLVPIVESLPYEDIVIWDNSFGTMPDYKIFGRYAALTLAKNTVVYWQDDDVIFTAHDELLTAYEPNMIISNMDQPWIDGAQYGDFLGMVGAGSLCDIDLPSKIFAEYLKRFAFDDDVLLECDFIFGTLAPFKRVDLGYEVREFADDPDRLYQQPWQAARKWKIIDRCKKLKEQLGDLISVEQVEQLAEVK